MTKKKVNYKFLEIIIWKNSAIKNSNRLVKILKLFNFLNNKNLLKYLTSLKKMTIITWKFLMQTNIKKKNKKTTI